MWADLLHGFSLCIFFLLLRMSSVLEKRYIERLLVLTFDFEVVALCRMNLSLTHTRSWPFSATVNHRQCLPASVFFLSSSVGNLHVSVWKLPQNNPHLPAAGSGHPGTTERWKRFNLGFLLCHSTTQKPSVVYFRREDSWHTFYSILIPSSWSWLRGATPPPTAPHRPSPPSSRCSNSRVVFTHFMNGGTRARAPPLSSVCAGRRAEGGKQKDTRTGGDKVSLPV